MYPDQNFGGPRPPKAQEVKLGGGAGLRPPPPRTAYGLMHFHIPKHLITKHLIVLFAFPISRLRERPRSIKFSTKINQILVLIKILV